MNFQPREQGRYNFNLTLILLVIVVLFSLISAHLISLSLFLKKGSIIIAIIKDVQWMLFLCHRQLKRVMAQLLW